ncbi:uncharacterized protein LOC133554543 isoform X3 [Nerophis ophidion]|uniref:uncharacterized protein LOC133554543 isoform X3 n=1 Tax=Nerophis ophidion TaxID=159077 RepID=UPI002ADF1F63|nr:uncharacterized protein LOC133554543 isoform X3 [Nerophis ophidion]
MLQVLIKERLMAAADEIFALFERTIASYEEELYRTRGTKARHLKAVSEVPIVLDFEDVQQRMGCQEGCRPQWGSSTSRQEYPQAPQVKEEDKELWIAPKEECLRGQGEAYLAKLPLAVVSVKTEDHEDKPPDSSQPHRSPVLMWKWLPLHFDGVAPNRDVDMRSKQSSFSSRRPAVDWSARRRSFLSVCGELKFRARRSTAH